MKPLRPEHYFKKPMKAPMKAPMSRHKGTAVQVGNSPIPWNRPPVEGMTNPSRGRARVRPSTPTKDPSDPR